MDINRGVLDNLMGRDRNLPKNSKHSRDHFSNSDVCKPFLICFCFNTLFPNTVFDEGPCNKRHDTYLKTMFEGDPNRSELEKVYIKDCINWIERRLQDAEQKTKKNQNTIESKSSLSTERPRQILDRILAIDKDIEDMMAQAAIFGENGQIDDSARCLEEVERLRERRIEVDLMGDNLLAVVKQQKICEVCGAIQTINDTEKRIQMHLEGKIHQGFLRLRAEIETLKIRLQIIQQKLDKNREKNLAIAPEPHHQPEPPAKIVHQKPKQPQKAEEKQKQKQEHHEKPKQKERQKEKKEREEGDRHSPSKKKEKKHKHKQERSPERRDSRDRKKKNRSPDRKSEERDRQYRRDRDSKKDKDKKRRQKSRSGERDYHRDRSRSREKDRRAF